MASDEKQLSQVQECLCLLSAGRCALEGLPRMRRREIIVLRGRSGHHKLLMRYTDGLRGRSVKLDRGIEAPTSFRKITAKLRKNSVTNQRAAGQFGSAGMDADL